MLDLSVVIVNYNSGLWLKRCIDSILMGNDLSLEIIVVDNNSKDNSVSFLRESPYREKVVLEQLTENLGYSGGNNYGVKLSKHKNILILNPDVLVTEGGIEEMCLYFQNLSDKKKVILAPRLTDEKGVWQESCWVFPGVKDVVLEAMFLSNLKLFRKKEKGLSVEECDVLSGAVLMMSKERYLELNGFDEHLFWMEDVDICFRNKKTGGRNLLLNIVSFFHYQGGSSNAVRDKVIANQIFSRFKYFRKHLNSFNFLIVNVFLIFQSITRWLVFFILSWFNSVYALKYKGYWLAMKKIFYWLFTKDEKIIP